jgi:hypothetical protein
MNDDLGKRVEVHGFGLYLFTRLIPASMHGFFSINSTIKSKCLLESCPII